MDFVVLRALSHFVIATTVAAGGRSRASLWLYGPGQFLDRFPFSLFSAGALLPASLQAKKKGREGRPW